jgi:hypothetical protein
VRELQANYSSLGSLAGKIGGIIKCVGFWQHTVAEGCSVVEAAKVAAGTSTAAGEAVAIIIDSPPHFSVSE